MATQVNIPEVTASEPAQPVNGKERKPSYAELQARLAQVEAQLAAKPAQSARVTFMTSSNKSAQGDSVMMLYGLGRFPVSLYPSQWDTVVELAKNGSVEKALAAHRAGKLAVKTVENRK